MLHLIYLGSLLLEVESSDINNTGSRTFQKTENIRIPNVIISNNESSRESKIDRNNNSLNQAECAVTSKRENTDSVKSTKKRDFNDQDDLLTDKNFSKKSKNEALFDLNKNIKVEKLQFTNTSTLINNGTYTKSFSENAMVDNRAKYINNLNLFTAFIDIISRQYKEKTDENQHKKIQNIDEPLDLTLRKKTLEFSMLTYYDITNLRFSIYEREISMKNYIDTNVLKAYSNKLKEKYERVHNNLLFFLQNLNFKNFLITKKYPFIDEKAANINEALTIENKTFKFPIKTIFCESIGLLRQNFRICAKMAFDKLKKLSCQQNKIYEKIQINQQLKYLLRYIQYDSEFILIYHLNAIKMYIDTCTTSLHFEKNAIENEKYKQFNEILLFYVDFYGRKIDKTFNRKQKEINKL